MDFSQRQTYAVIVAGGSGSRVGGDLPKQFLQVAGKPVIVYAIEAFVQAMPNIKILVAVNASFKDHWEALKAQFFPEQNILTVEGGDQRFHSVQKALAAIANDENALVAIHDSVRPLLSSALISRCFAKAASNGAVIPVMPMRASLRKKAADKTLAVNRAEYVSVQTPQVFNLKKLKAVYQQEYQESFTDDASVYESAGNEIVTVAGEATNIKVTYKEDLEIVATLLNIRD